MAQPVHFRIMVGSYEHNLLCVSLTFHKDTAVFQPIFHFAAHSLSIKCIDYAKRYLVTGSNDEHIRIYDLQKRKELGTLLSHQGTVTTLQFSREAEVASKNQETTQGKEVKNKDASGKWLLSGSEDGKIIIWRTKDWEPFATLKGHTDKVSDLAIHPSGRVAISVSRDQTIRLWNLMTAKKAAVLKIKGKFHRGEPGEFVCWINNGSHFVVGLLNMVLIYHTGSAKCVKKIKFSSTLMHMKSITIDNDEFFVTGHGNGKIEFTKVDQLLTGTSEDVKDVDLKEESLNPEFCLQGHTNRIKAFSYYNNPISTNGTPFLVSVGSDGKIVVWDLNQRDQVAVYDTGERLNCVIVCPEEVEKMDTVKRVRQDEDEFGVSGSEYETDGEEIKTIMKGDRKKKNKSKKNKKPKVSVTLE